MSQLSRQGSYELRSSQDAPMGDAPELTNSQMSAVLDYDERLEDGHRRTTFCFTWCPQKSVKEVVSIAKLAEPAAGAKQG